MMTALILNSGIGSRMGDLTERQPKCMTPLWEDETIASLYLRRLVQHGIQKVVMTTGYCAELLEQYCESLKLPLSFTYVRNPRYQETNYIYSMYLARPHLTGDILYLHGDMTFEDEALEKVLNSPKSCVAVSRSVALPEKDFKAVLENGRVTKIGVEFFENAVAAQPLYKLLAPDFARWMERIAAFCETDNTSCYAENALNEITAECEIIPVDVGTVMCGEVDTPMDLENVRARRRNSCQKQSL